MVAACALLVVGCASTKPVHVWTAAALDAESRQVHGDLAAADARYLELLPTAPDPHRRRWLLFNRAEIAIEQGRQDDARAILTGLVEDPREDLWGANAAWTLAELDDDPGARAEAMVEVIRRYPDEVAAERSLRHLERSARERGELEAFITLTETLEAEVEGRLIGDNLLRSQAIAQEELGRLDEAIRTYARLFETYSDESLADDALWEIARIYREVQNWDAALPLLERIATDVESSWFVGSYASEWVDDSILLLAEINLLYLGRHDEAIRWYDYYVSEYPYGFKADDAAWGAVEARRLAGRDAAHFSAMKAFVRDYPESRWSRVARARLGMGGDDDSN